MSILSCKDYIRNRFCLAQFIAHSRPTVGCGRDQNPLSLISGHATSLHFSAHLVVSCVHVTKSKQKEGSKRNVNHFQI